MIVDTSALLAIIMREPDRARFGEAIAIASVRGLSAASYLEAALKLERRGEIALLDLFIARLRLTVEPVTANQARIAVVANRQFGKGRHPAQLNFGDCLVYALARDTGEPLLFKGDDFGLTDIGVAALPESR